MPNKFVCIKELKSDMTKTNKPYRVVFDQDNFRWSLFEGMPLVELNKSYIFDFQQENGYNNIKNIIPLVNIFQQKALQETANINDIKKDLGVSLRYATDLVIAKLIPLDELYSRADEIHQYLCNTAQSLMPKEGDNHHDQNELTKT